MKLKLIIISIVFGVVAKSQNIVPHLTSIDTFTNKTMSGADNSFSNIPQLSVTGLIDSIAALRALAILRDTLLFLNSDGPLAIHHNILLSKDTLLMVGGTMSGTGGAGFLGLPPQSSTPSTPTSGVRIYARSTGAFSWIGVNGFTRSILGTYLTADHAWQLQNKDGTFADSTDLALNITNTATNTSNIATNTTNIATNTTNIATNTTNIALAKLISDSVVSTGYATQYDLTKTKDSLQTNITLKSPLTAVGLAQEWILAASDETTAITTGTGKLTFRTPYAVTLTGVRASVNTVSSSGIPTFNIKEAGTTIFSTNLTIDANEKSSTTAATSYVFSDTTLADDAEITFDFVVAGTGAKGVKIIMYYTRN